VGAAKASASSAKNTPEHDSTWMGDGSDWAAESRSGRD